jgi:hypothetical protein
VTREEEREALDALFSGRTAPADAERVRLQRERDAWLAMLRLPRPPQEALDARGRA